MPSKQVEPSTVEGPGFELRISGTYVRVGDHHAPEWMEATYFGNASAPTIEWRCEVRDGAPRIVLLTLRSTEVEGEVQQKHLRSTHVDAFEALYAAFAIQLDDKGRHDYNYAIDRDGRYRTAAVASIHAVRQKRRVTPAFLREIARVYRDNIDTAPTKAIQDRYFVSPRQASNYVSAARKAGLLPPTERGRKKA